MAKLSEEDAEEIRRLFFSKTENNTQKQIAYTYGISQSEVSLIVLGERWTRVQSKRDSDRVDHQIRGEMCSFSKLTESDIREIRNKYGSGSTQTDLSKEYGVSQAHISSIVLRKSWKHVS